MDVGIKKKKSKIGNLNYEVENWKSEIGSQKMEVESQPFVLAQSNPI